MEGDLRGQAEIWELMLSHANSMALKCAVELRIPDIIKNSGGGGPITLSQIASEISGDDPSPETTSMLSRIMNLLVRRNVFSADKPHSGGETFYGLTPSSTWLLTSATSSSSSLSPMVLLQTHEAMVASWGCLSQQVKKGGSSSSSGFKKVNGVDLYENASPEFGKVLNRGFECTAEVVASAMAAEGFGREYEGVGSAVDVGGGTGGMLAEIVKKYPKLKGINFDLPHVVAAAAEYPGVRHVGGDMFDSVPKADLVFLKWVLHNWSDEDCVKILKNCRKAIISKRTGKLIIVEMVMEKEGHNNNNNENDTSLFGDTALMLDVAMIAYHSGGKERTAKQWKELLTRGDFSLSRIVNIPALPSIIEAFPK